MEAKEGGSKEGGQGAPSMAHTGVLGGGDGGDREGERQGLPAGLLRRLCLGLFLAAPPGCLYY
jgi:hypothetical protein